MGKGKTKEDDRRSYLVEKGSNALTDDENARPGQKSVPFLEVGREFTLILTPSRLSPVGVRCQ